MLSSRRDFATVTRQFFAPLLYILYAADFNYLIRRVIVTYILLDISVVNSHATSAYECKLLAVTWHYLPSVGIGDSAVKTAPILPTPCSLFTMSVAFFTRSKLITAFILATLKQ